jgi:hypothetical protein
LLKCELLFVIFAVIIGMAAGAFNLAVASMGLVVVSVAAFWMRPKRLAASGGGEYALELRVGVGRDLKDLVGPVLDQHAADYRLLSVGTAKQGLSISASYLVRIKTERSADGLVQALNVIEGVQNVELTTPKDDADDDPRFIAAGAGHRRRCGCAGAARPRCDRWVDGINADHAGADSGGLHAVPSGQKEG